MDNLLKPPEALLAAHDRLRGSDFPIVSVIGAHTPLDARIWLGRWATQRRRNLILAPFAAAEAALSMYNARFPALSKVKARQSEDASSIPILLLPGGLAETLPVAVEVVEQVNYLPVALACGIAGIIEHLLDAAVPVPLVGAALQGLVPAAETEQQILKTVAEARRLEPYLRGPCEGLVFYMLQARAETRDRFAANYRLVDTASRQMYEVDLICLDAKLIVEIDGPEHNRTKKRSMDQRRQRELEAQGYRVRRFSNDQVIEDPVGVWRLIAEQMTLASKG